MKHTERSSWCQSPSANGSHDLCHGARGSQRQPDGTRYPCECPCHTGGVWDQTVAIYAADLPMVQELAQWHGLTLPEALHLAIEAGHVLTRTLREGGQVITVQADGTRAEFVLELDNGAQSLSGVER